MKLHDKEAILAELQRGQAALLHALKDVPEDGAGRAPGPGKWSILECVEHLAVAEEYLLSQMISARQCDAPVVDERRGALITARGADRTTRNWQAVAQANSAQTRLCMTSIFSCVLCNLCDTIHCQ